MSKFVHLHTHSHYSLLDGLGKIPDLVNRAKELKMEALALTDHGVMYGAIEFYKECLKAGIKPIIGTEMYIAPRRMQDKETKTDGSPYHLVLLAKNETGYKNLLKIVSAAHLEGFYYKPRVDKKYLANHAEGLIALSACMGGEIPLNSSQKDKIVQIANSYLKIFGKENFFLELQFHPEYPDQGKINQALIDLAKKTGIALVATNDIHYVKKEDKDAHEVLLAVQTGKNYDDNDRMTLKNFDLSMTSPEEMLKLAGNPEYLENAAKIAGRCDLKISLGQTILPKFEVPKGETAKTYLEKLCQEGMIKRYGKVTTQVKERLNYELSIIEKCKFEDYFLIVADYVGFAKESGILVGPGRGSAAGSMVSYVLDITDLDPIEYNLLFERFLNPERISPPDIDLDFADDRREEVIQYISKKYGQDHVAQIITFGVMKARMAIRDVARALGMSYDDGDRIAKLIPMGLTLDESLSTVSELKSIYENEPNFTKLIDMAKRLENVVRNAGTHAAGVVISEKPLTEYVPLQHPPKGEESLITQYSMNYLDDIGLLKVDILGLANLTIIKNCLRIIRKISQSEIDLDKIPNDDKKTFELLSAGATAGVFQLESDGMKRYLKDLKPNNFEDILSMVALYRPGPMESINDFINAKHGRKKITYLDPKLQPILEKTYGVIVTQDQVLQIARYFAGFSYGEADILRKAVGKKIKKLLDEQKEKFLSGAIKTGADKKTAENVWNFIEPFAKYGFNRAHAACYAKISYQTAYLKARYPSAFMAAWLTAEQQNIDKIAFAVAECRRMNIEVLPPDVNESFVEFGVVKDTNNIRFGLAAIKNVGAGVSEKIVEERKTGGPYVSLEDFLKRLTGRILNKKVIEALVKSGGLDRFGERNQMLSAIEQILKFISNLDKKAAKDQLNLFSEKTKIEVSKLVLPETPPADKKLRLSWEKELLGMYISDHPLKGMENVLSEAGTPINELDSKNIGKKVKIAGIITYVRKIVTKNKEPMLFATLEDISGKTEVLVFPKVLKQNNQIWQTDSIVAIEGKTNSKDGDLKIIAESITEVNIGQHKEMVPNKMIINIPSSTKKDLLEKIKEIISNYPGEIPVWLKIPKNGGFNDIKTKSSVSFDRTLQKKLNELLGQKAARFDTSTTNPAI